MLAYFKLAILGLIVLTTVGAIDGKTMTQTLVEAEMDALATFSNIYEESVKPQDKCLESGLCNKNEECCSHFCLVFPGQWHSIPPQCVECAKTGSPCDPELFLCCSRKCIPHPHGLKIHVCA